MNIKLIAGVLILCAGLAWTYNRQLQPKRSQARVTQSTGRQVASVPVVETKSNAPVVPVPVARNAAAAPKAAVVMSEAQPPAELVAQFTRDGEAAIADRRLLPEDLNAYVESRLGRWHATREEMTEVLDQDDFVEHQASVE